MIHQLKDLKPIREGSTFFKAPREDGLYSAVKIFPFVFSDDQKKEIEQRTVLVRTAIEDFRAEISNVIEWGVSGSFSFIEFDWIIGMSLAEKFKIERNSLLTISEILHVAEQISRTLTFCHKTGLQHGAISLDDIIWDAAKKRYALTGFFKGLQAKNKVQYKAREEPGLNKVWVEDRQKKDIKDLSIVLLQMLTGNSDREVQGENHVNAAREKSIPSQWSKEVFDHEKTVPSWFTQLLTAGISGSQFTHMGDFYFSLIQNNKQPLTERRYRSKPYVQATLPPLKKIEKISELYSLPGEPRAHKSSRRFVFDGKMAGGLLLAGLLFGFSMFSQKKHLEKEQVAAEEASMPVTHLVREIKTEAAPDEKKLPEVKKEKKVKPVEPLVRTEDVVVADVVAEKPDIGDGSQTLNDETISDAGGLGFYMVKSKAYFHNEPDESTKRKGFIIHWNNAILIPIKEENDFVYVVFTNKEGQTSRGWLKKSDLIEVGEK